MMDSFDASMISGRGSIGGFPLFGGYNIPGSALDPNRSILASSPRASPLTRRGYLNGGRGGNQEPRRKGKARKRESSNVFLTSSHPSKKGSRGAHPLANDTTDVFADSDDDLPFEEMRHDAPRNEGTDGDDEDEYEAYEEVFEEDLVPMEWSTLDRMRLWRHDALMQHLYETAAFWGDKILSWSNDPNDAFWLAQTYFTTHQYARAYRLLTRPFPTGPPNVHPPNSVHGSAGSTSDNTAGGVHSRAPSAQSVHGSAEGSLGSNGAGSGSKNTLDAAGTSAQPNPFKGKAKEISETATKAHITSQISLMPTQQTGTVVRLPMGSAGLSGTVGLGDGASRLVDLSLACRYLAAQCMVRCGKWADAMELIGESNPFKGSATSGPSVANKDGGIKIEASMCYLRGLIMLKLNRADQAKTCFMEALALDVKCADAFMMLVNCEMLSGEEEWNFIQSLNYSTQMANPADAEFVQLMYTSRLRKDNHAREHELTRMRLVDDYGLGDNPDVLFAFADALYTSFRWGECFAVTSRILALTSLHTPTVPLHIACMYHLNHLHSKLFLLAHEMVDREPENPLSWYAVGIWYLTNGKWGDARAYLSKTTLMDPRFAPAWAAFGHTFALEAEHDHAVTAYSTCARIFPGSHLPLLFIGMEQIMLSNFKLADEALAASYALCPNDPLLCNERGVMAYNHGDYEKAVTLFRESISRAEVTQSSQKTWAVTLINLGTSLRKMRRYEEALKIYEQVVEYDPRHSMALGLLGMTHHLLGQLDPAILKYHEALSIDPINPNMLELLNTALESRSTKTVNDVVHASEFFDASKVLMAKWKKAFGQAGSSVGQMKIPLKGLRHAQPNIHGAGSSGVGRRTQDEDAMQE